MLVFKQLLTFLKAYCSIESSSVLIYYSTEQDIYTQNGWLDAIINYMELLNEIYKSGRGSNGCTTKGKVIINFGENANVNYKCKMFYIIGHESLTKPLK
jgi:hypothetical protein